MIAASGLRLLVDEKVDCARPRNLALTAVIFVVGLSSAFHIDWQREIDRNGTCHCGRCSSGMHIRLDR